MKEIQWCCHVKIPVQFIQDNLLHSANFSWRTTTKAIPSQHFQYWNPLQKPRQKEKKQENQLLEKSHKMLHSCPGKWQPPRASKGRAGKADSLAMPREEEQCYLIFLNGLCSKEEAADCNTVQVLRTGLWDRTAQRALCQCEAAVMP